MKITQQEFDKLRDIDKIRINSSISRITVQSSMLIMIGVIAGLFSIHNLFLFNIISMLFFFIIEFSCIWIGVYSADKHIKRIHVIYFDENGKVKESYLKKYKIKN
jgi:hypothetical protein